MERRIARTLRSSGTEQEPRPSRARGGIAGPLERCSRDLHSQEEQESVAGTDPEELLRSFEQHERGADGEGVGNAQGREEGEIAEVLYAEPGGDEEGHAA